jgi:hypothetical protein
VPYCESVRRLITWSLAAVSAFLLAAPVATATVTTEAVLNTSATEIEPSIGNGFFGWAQASKAHPRRFNVFAKPDGGSRFKVNEDGTTAFASDIDDTTFVFGQRSGNRAGNIKFFDLDSKMVSTPAGVNTPLLETGGKLAGSDLLFGRYSNSSGKIYLFDLDTQKQTLLDSIAAPGYVQTGDVDGGYAAWIRCRRFAHCNTFVYDLTTGFTTHVPNPQRRSQYAVSLADDGTVYFGESSNINCGESLAVWRWDVNGSRERLFGVGRHRDIAVTTPVENLGGSTTVYYDRYNCRSGAVDIFKTTVSP